MFDLPAVFNDPTNMAIFTAPDNTAASWRSFYIPRGATMLGIYTHSAGGGGGGGHTGATNTNRGGGGGGSAGARCWFLFPTIFLPTPAVQFRCGIGGAGGNATQAGSSGGQTLITVMNNPAQTAGASFGFGGGAGTGSSGGTGASAPGSAPQLHFMLNHLYASSGPSLGGAGGSPSGNGSGSNNDRFEGAGAGGGGCNTTNVSGTGGPINLTAGVPTLLGGQTAGAPGSDGYGTAGFGPPWLASGGAGGAANGAGTGGAGGRGGLGCGGGGGGGGITGGPGGRGGDGYIVFYWW